MIMYLVPYLKGLYGQWLLSIQFIHDKLHALMYIMSDTKKKCEVDKSMIDLKI